MPVATVCLVKVTILAPGSRGDIQPYIALGQGFRAAGHSVRLVTTIDHEALVRAHHLECSAAPISVQAALEGREASAAIEGGGLIASFRQLAKLATRAAELIARVGLDASKGADLLVTGFGAALVADGIARKLGVPLVQAYNVPLTPTGAFPGVLFPGLDFGPRSRRLGHRLSRAALWMTGRASANGARRAVLDAPSAPLFVPSHVEGLVEGPVVYGFSEALLPRGPEWSAAVEVTGFWFAEPPEGFTPPPGLVDFLAAGAPPVCLGFGSMTSRDPKATSALVLDAVKQAGVRAVVLSGWAGLEASALPSNVFVLEGVAHSWLYPRCQAVVHHGGAGTTAAALLAGVPSIVVPFHGDQPFWARRVHAAGVGPPPVPRTKLTARSLAEAMVDAANNQPQRARAAAMGATLGAERGVERGVEAILRLAGKGR